MVKIETLTFEYTHGGECPNAEADDDSKCRLTRRKIPDLWGEIPKWCPLPDKKENE